MAGIRRDYEIWSTSENAQLLDNELRTKDEAFAAAPGYAREQESGFVMVINSDTGEVYDVA